MLSKLFEFAIDTATSIFILGAGIAIGRLFSIFTESAGMYLRDKLSNNVYSIISIIFSLLIIVLVLYKVVVG